jgi:hypothetical protein
VNPDEQALLTIVDLLTDLGVTYMLTGSIAASYYGRPRATHDADIVIDPAPDQLEELLTRVERAGFYVDASRARDSLRTRRAFNIIDTQYASKIDLIIRRDREFSVNELARRTTADLPWKRGVSIVSPEDALLSKLEWARAAGDSERQLADVAGMLAVQSTLDRQYIERWASRLGVADLWHRVAGPS